jgi:hypothetical protein
MFEAIDGNLVKELARVKRGIAGASVLARGQIRRARAFPAACAGAGDGSRQAAPDRQKQAPSLPLPHIACCATTGHTRTDTITAANEAHAAKEKAQAEASALKLTAEKEHAAFEEEWRQLTRLIEDNK